MSMNPPAPKLSQWLPEFIVDHKNRFPRPDWPSGEEARVFFSTWHTHFLRAGLLHREVADEASERLALDPPAFLDNHLPRLLEIAQVVYRERNQRGEITHDNSREAAERASRDCDCGGTGLTSIKDDRGYSFGAYCGNRCPAQQWVERQHREKSPDVHRRFLAAERYRQQAAVEATF